MFRIAICDDEQIIGSQIEISYYNILKELA